MATKHSPDPAANPPTFEQALAQLEEIVQDLEAGELGLAQGLTRYEQGVALLKQCYQILEHAERRIELLNGINPDGNARSEPFDDAAVSLDEKAQTRGRRRSRASGTSSPSDRDQIDGPGSLF